MKRFRRFQFAKFSIPMIVSLMSCSAYVFAEQTYDTQPQVGIDASGQIAGVWTSFDRPANQYYITGSYGSIFPSNPTVISDRTAVRPYASKIQVATSSQTTTKAAAVWLANDLFTNNSIVQATTLTALGWNDQPTTLSKNDGSEKPNNDFEVEITPDGTNIVVTWSAIDDSGNSVIRCALSTNGGLTWTLPN